ncbi:radical SAM/SPASM domain-containing protein [Thermodesulfitimonas autotrophica]|uniref:radical SAM/SPASM domain-containing protein n=1 Tax=Thermodesulfitimonas autotrophica TaxID=1894989 RepID=UPI002FE109B8
MLPERVKLTENLLVFEKDGMILLVNGAEMRPLLVRRGGGFIRRFLADANRIGETAEILRHYQDEPLFEVLLGHRILVAEDDPEQYPPGNCGGQTGPRAGISLYLLLSQGCNLRCLYCLNGEETYRRSAGVLMPEEVAFRAVEMCLERLAPGGELEIVFFGGEPLLNWPLAKKIILYCEEVLRERFPDRGWRYHLTSNLTFLPPDLTEWVKRYRISILCDVDGPAALHDRTRPFRNGKGSHRRIAANIRRLKNEGIEVALRCTVTAYNVDHMVPVAAHHRELGGAGCAFVPVNAVTSDEEILPAVLLPDPARYAAGLKAVFESGLWEVEKLFPFNQYLSMLKPGLRTALPCGAPYGNTPVVDASGDIYACIYLVGIKAYKIGNVFAPEGFPDERVTARMMEVLRVDNIAECRRCALRYLCASGCPVGRLLIEGNPRAGAEVVKYTKEVKCAGIKAVVESLLWHCAATACQEAATLKSREVCV